MSNLYGGSAAIIKGSKGRSHDLKSMQNECRKIKLAKFYDREQPRTP